MKVRVVEEAVDQLIKWSDEAAPLETGGVLLGMFADGEPWVTAVAHVDNAERTRSRYELPAGVTQDIVRRARARDDRVGYLGDWHSHPADVGPSSTDLGSLRRIAARAIGMGNRPPIIVVVRRGKGGWGLDGRMALRWPFETRPVDVVLTGPPATVATSPTTRSVSASVRRSRRGTVSGGQD
jgi:integrative and conjugative element protein (TIGR02256 family)